ncbi:MAG: hypothetical protein ABSC23_08830 [Bryobacteraceae bacterium]|jgi:ABC-type transporter Mla MlaB component
MLKITLHDASAELRLCLEGKLSGPWARELRQCWRTAASTTGGRRTVVDLREVDFVDAEGQAVLADMHAAGVRFLAATPVIQAALREAARAPRCVTVEEQPSRTSDGPLRGDTPGPHPRTL